MFWYLTVKEEWKHSVEVAEKRAWSFIPVWWSYLGINISIKISSVMPITGSSSQVKKLICNYKCSIHNDKLSADYSWSNNTPIITIIVKIALETPGSFVSLFILCRPGCGWRGPRLPCRGQQKIVCSARRVLSSVGSRAGFPALIAIRSEFCIALLFPSEADSWPWLVSLFFLFHSEVILTGLKNFSHGWVKSITWLQA